MTTHRLTTPTVVESRILLFYLLQSLLSVRGLVRERQTQARLVLPRTATPRTASTFTECFTVTAVRPTIELADDASWTG